MNTKSNAILCFLYKFVVFNASFEKIEKHSSSCKGERYNVLFLLISRLTVAGQSPALAHFALIVAKIFFTATAAITIRAILPFSLRLCECFLYF